MQDNQTTIRLRLDRFRRFILTALLYVMFGLGALVVSVLAVLPIAVFSRDRDRRVCRVRRVIRYSFNSFTYVGSALGVFEVSFINTWRLDQPGQLIIANHPSLLDVVFLLGHIPNANCVVKKNLLKNPFLAIQVYFADYIRNDEGDELLQNCIAALERGEPVILFPEGTRTVEKGNYKFKRGAAYLMLRSNCPVRPVFISCQPAALGKRDPWYVIPERKITYRFTVLAELDLTSIRHTDHTGLPLKSRRLTGWLVDWYQTMFINGPDCLSEPIIPPDLLLDNRARGRA